MTAGTCPLCASDDAVTVNGDEFECAACATLGVIVHADDGDHPSVVTAEWCDACGLFLVAHPADDGGIVTRCPGHGIVRHEPDDGFGPDGCMTEDYAPDATEDISYKFDGED